MISGQHGADLAAWWLPSSLGKCDVEECDDLAAEFGIRNIPTILFFKNGEVVDKLVGAVAKAKFEEKFEALL